MQSAGLQVRIVDMSAWNCWAEFAVALHRVDRQQELLEAALVAAPTLPTEEPPDRAGSFL